MFIKLTKKIIALTLALMFASVFLLAACGDGTGADKNYTVTFDTGVADLTVPAITGKAGAPVTAPADLEREGYVFAGWTYNGQSYSLSTIPARNITLTAKWNQFFTITFNSAGGSAVEPVVAAETERITAPADPVRENFKFNGWYNGDEKFFFTTMPHGDLTLTAKWLGAVTVTFDANAPGVTAPAPLVEIAGTPISAPPAPSNPGFYLSGWLLDGVPFSFTLMPDKNITLVAHWVTGVTISFETNVAGVTVAPLSGPPGASVSAPKDPVRTDGYGLEGWYLNPELSGERYKFSTLPSSDITLYAKWAKGATIKFNTGVEGLNVPDMVQVPGKVITAPAPIRPGFHFDGWFDGNRPYLFNVMPSADITLTAKWVTATKLPSLNVTIMRADGTLLPIGSVNRDRYEKALISIGGSDGSGAPGGGLDAVPAQFRGRGVGSWSASKKQYRIKFDDKQSVLGMPKSRHWVLVASVHGGARPDNPVLKADSAYSLTRELLTGIEYATRTAPVDVYFNGEYWGVYTWSEKVRVESNRIDIESEHNVLDTGYLMTYTWYMHVNSMPGYSKFQVDELKRKPGGANTGNPFTIRSPDSDDVSDPAKPEVTQAGYTAQRDYIQGEVKKLAAALISGDYNRVDALADIPSFIDNIIIQELFRNTDVGDGGYYLIKKSTKQGGKFYSGPPWDWDWAMMYGDGSVLEDGGGVKLNPFMTYFYAIPEIKAQTHARWKQVSADVRTFLTNFFNGYMDDPGYRQAFGRNFIRWHGSNEQNGGTNWFNSAKDMRDALLSRVTWMDNRYK